MAWGLGIDPVWIEVLFWAAVALWFLVPLLLLGWFFSWRARRRERRDNAELFAAMTEAQIRKDRGD